MTILFVGLTTLIMFSMNGVPTEAVSFEFKDISTTEHYPRVYFQILDNPHAPIHKHKNGTIQQWEGRKQLLLGLTGQRNVLKQIGSRYLSKPHAKIKGQSVLRRQTVIVRYYREDVLNTTTELTGTLVLEKGNLKMYVDNAFVVKQ